MGQPVVKISTGKLCGKVGKNFNNKAFFCFHGIPYAKPPIGPLRFKAPQPAEPWSGIRDATQDGTPCISRHPVLKSLIGSEDCLTLNVYTRDLPKEGSNFLKPVMVWIHGGGFTSGSGSSEIYGPEFLMTEDIVLVSINYRIGIIGFLSLEDPDLEVPGNAGLKDMVMALKWVQENVIHFCGDPNNVTIFGESAGAAAAHYLILSPMARGLFHKAILQSGCALNLWARSRRYTTELGQVLGLQTTDERKVLEVLQKMSVEEMYLAAEKSHDPFIASLVRPHGPVIEKKPEGAFLCEDPVDLLESGRYNHVPIMIGYTTREGILSEVLQRPKPFKPITDFELAVPNFLKLQRGSDISKLVAKNIKEFYYGNEEPTDKNKDKFYLLETDNFFLREIWRTVKYHNKTSSVPIYFYRMSIETDLNLFKNMFSITEPGVSHADDLGYLFTNLLTPDIEEGSDEDIAVKRFVKLWTNFAKNGDPNPTEENPLINVTWKPVTRNEMNFLDIGTKLTTGVDPDSDRMAFWQRILKINPNNKL
ncbi:putative esterase [Tribolium castaneum]|uniref:Putative esterase n=1 Tax=Tribolium castaneum TaxID=7070 RepID=Q5WM40_TRICA|nr:putative esterase [Tribolium castaneum]CAH64511.1 putative esterase [Tribolium castaneum]|eukprot:NP_001034534.1 putative esterase [Tribolium castaneum]